jgi:hypothetical protein
MQAGKLHTLKKWQTVTEAARHLTTVLGEPVAGADILRLGLDGHLVLSVNLINPVPAVLCTGQTVEAIVMLSGVHDLPMTGLERHDVQCRFHSMLGLPWVMPQGPDEVLVRDTEGQVYALRQGCGYPHEAQTREIVVPMGALPDDGFLVVRAESLASFVESLDSGRTNDDDDLEDALSEAGDTLGAVGAHKPHQKQRDQERRVLEILLDKGLDPLKLPIRKSGVRGVKTETRMLALREASLFSKNSFDKTWERLRGYGDIAGG